MSYKSLSDAPWCQALNDWIESQNARVLWRELKTDREVSCYEAKGKIFVVVAYAHGWELLIPASADNDVKKTLEAAEAYLNAHHEGEN